VRVTAFDDGSRAGARAAVDWLLASLPGPAEGRPWRSFAAGADAARAARALRRGAAHLSRLPVVGEREAARLAAAADLLAPWGEAELRIEVWRDPDGAILTLEGAPAR
jgi:hypothetical protein